MLMQYLYKSFVGYKQALAFFAPNSVFRQKLVFIVFWTILKPISSQWVRYSIEGGVYDISLELVSEKSVFKILYISYKHIRTEQQQLKIQLNSIQITQSEQAIS